jgi:xylulose-5-phosphate/fructose-6-phosphate phosphoketolase
MASFRPIEAFVLVIIPCSISTPSGFRICTTLPWRAPVPSLNLSSNLRFGARTTSGFTHQDPGFIDLVVNKSPDVLPHLFAARCELFACVANHC